jgi:hypothetical protein
MTAPAAAPPRHPLMFWAAVAAASLVVGGGVLVAALGYAQMAGPDGAVRGYFAALARSDAPSALAFGDLPVGPHTLLTSTVLREQQRIAPIRNLSIVSIARQGSNASVKVEYTLAFGGDSRLISDTVRVYQRGGKWRLVHAAIPTQLDVVRGLQRATIVGAGIPEGTSLVFPGAVPIKFDTPYLQLDATQDSVSFAAGPTTQVVVEVSKAGKSAVVSAVTAALRACLGASGQDDRCPQPNERYVPHSLRGALVGAINDDVSARLAVGPSGALEITGDVQVSGTYRKLTFENQTVTGSGKLRLPIRARAYAVAPLQLTWDRPS